MSIIDELIQLLEKKSSEITIPKIRRVTIGLLFILIELENDVSGLAFNKINRLHIHSKDAGNLTSNSLLDLMKKARLANVEKSIGIAAINTLSQVLLSKNDVRTNIDIIDFMDFSPSDNLGMIGNMAPLARQIHGKVNALTVIEENQERWQVPQNVKVFSNYKDLTNINKLLITGSAILSDDFDEIINAFQDLDKIAIVGPTMGAIPEPFFKRNIDAIGGMRINDSKKVQQVILECGGTQNFKNYCDKYLIIND